MALTSGDSYNTLQITSILNTAVYRENNVLTLNSIFNKISHLVKMFKLELDIIGKLRLQTFYVANGLKIGA
jgi:hypothetical protein